MAHPVFFADDLDDAAPGSTVVLDGPEAHHAAHVVRLRSGEPVDVVDGRGRRIQGTVVDAGRTQVSVAVISPRAIAGSVRSRRSPRSVST